VKPLAALAALAAAAAVAHAGAGAAATGLSVSPLRLTLVGASPATITVENPSGRSVVVAVGRAGFALTLRGTPRVRAENPAAGWLRIRPRRFRLAPHAKRTLHVTSAPPSGTAPGDHPALLLLTTREPGEGRIRVLLRIGVVVLVRVPGKIVRRIEPLGLTVRRRGEVHVLELRLANRGNVAALVGLQLELARRGTEVGRLRARRRLELLPHSAGIAEFVYRGRLRGRMTARVMGRVFALDL
jgi:hypothetical protein